MREKIDKSVCGLEWRTRDRLPKELVYEQRIEDEGRQRVQGRVSLTEERHVQKSQTERAAVLKKLNSASVLGGVRNKGRIVQNEPGEVDKKLIVESHVGQVYQSVFARLCCSNKHPPKSQGHSKTQVYAHSHISQSDAVLVDESLLLYSPEVCAGERCAEKAHILFIALTYERHFSRKHNSIDENWFTRPQRDTNRFGVVV